MEHVVVAHQKLNSIGNSDGITVKGETQWSGNERGKIFQLKIKISIKSGNSIANIVVVYL